MKRKTYLFLLLLAGLATVTGSAADAGILTPGASGRLRGAVPFDPELAPGNYAVRIDLLTKASAPDALLSARVENLTPGAPALMEPRPLAANRDWSSQEFCFTLKQPGRVRLLLSEHQSQGKIDAVQFRNARLTEFPIEFNRNLLPNDGYLNGGAGDYPGCWHPYPAALPAAAGLVAQPVMEKGAMTFRFTTGSSRAVLQGNHYPLPSKGAIEFSVWTKCPQGERARMTLFLLGDKYKWMNRKSFEVGDSWRKFTLRADRLPDRIQHAADFWPRIDLEPGKTLLIGRMELKYLPPETSAPQTKRNEVLNPDFFSGTYGWSFFAPEDTFVRGTPTALRKLRAWRPPHWENDTLTVYPDTRLTSAAFPVIPERKYTILLRMKSATAAPARCRVFLLDGNWKYAAHDFTLDGKYRTCAFSGTLPRSRFHRGYLRIDVKDAPLTIDRVRVVAGDAEDFEQEPVKFGFLGRNVIPEDDRSATLELRASAEHSIDAELLVRDSGRRLLRRETLHFPAGEDQRRTLRINPEGRRGVFQLTLRSGETEFCFPFAVLKDLSKVVLKENPLASHLAPFAKGAEPELLDRYLGFRQQRFSRFFLREVADLKLDPELLASLRSFHPFLVACLPTAGEMKSPFAVADRITPELAEAYRNELRSMLGKLGGAVQGVELFNEPHLWRFRDGPRKDFPNMPPRKVAEFYRIAREEIDRMHSPLRLLGPVAGKEYGLAFLDEGGADTIDIYSFHGYNETPDAGKIFEQLTKYRTVLSEKKRPRPLWNTEAYYGVRNHAVWEMDSEAQRPYFADTESDHAANCAVNLVHHAAAGAVWAPFRLAYFWSGIRGRENLVLEAFSAVNAAIEQLSNAGRGEEFPLGSAFHCFLFPGAAEGPLAVLYTMEKESHAVLRIPEAVEVRDMDGNRIAARAVGVGNAPLYLRLPKEEFRTVLGNLEFRGLGNPFTLDVSIIGRRELSVAVANRTNRPERLTVTPRTAFAVEPAFAETSLPPGGKRVLRFLRKTGNFQSMQEYRLPVELHSGETTIAAETLRKPVFAMYGENAANAERHTVSNPGPVWNQQPHTGPEDLGAKFAGFWNERGIGLSVIVTDDCFHFADTPPAAWQNDSLQIYFARENTSKRFDQCDYTVGLTTPGIPFAYLNHAPEGRFIGEANATEGIDTAVRVTVKKTASNTLQYDLFFPAEVLPGIAMKAGNSLRFSLLINDNDRNGRKTGLTLNPPGTEPYRNSRRFPELVLIFPDDSDDTAPPQQ